MIVYQIPSTTEFGRDEAYPESLSSFKLFGSLIEFSSPPKFGSEFEGYIFVGSAADYESIDVDATIESGDTIIQENEVSPRGIINVLSATRLAVTNSNGQKNTNPLSGINPGSIGEYGWWLSHLVRDAKVRESLRVRRTIPSEIIVLPGGVFPLSGATLFTTSIASIQVDNISTDLPTSPDDDTNLITFALPANGNFPARRINARYTNFIPKLDTSVSPPVPSPSGNNEINGVKLGGDLPFDQIIQVGAYDGNPITETFESDPGAIGIRSQYRTVEFQSGKTAKVINWDPANNYLYLKLDDTAQFILNTDRINGTNLETTDHDLIATYQSLTVGAEVYYNF